MECNKEEAIRAKELAERKMESKDFINAKKVAQKAQKLYPDLKDISQMILVCDVHCAAQNKVYGNENDWYGILQVEPTADEMSIKKQYRKLALLLHPDKNKLAGASDAFKFVGEAQKVLLDSEKRMMYDRKCKAVGRYPVSNRTMQQGNRAPNPRGVHSWFQNPFPNNANEFMNQQHQQLNQQMQSGSDNDRPTFWTVCPFCSVRYQYYKELVNRTLFCQNCKKSFSGYEMNAPVGNSGTNFSQPTYSRQRGVIHNHGTSVPQSTSRKSSSRTANMENVNLESSREKMFASDKTLKRKQKKRNRSVASSESSDSGSSTDADEGISTKGGSNNGLGENFWCHNEQNLRRSARSKQKVSYDENLSSDDDLMEPSKRSRSSASFCAVEEEAAPDMGGNQKEVKREENSAKLDVQNGQKEAGKSYEQASVPKDDEKNINPTVYEYPDPEFSDFDKERKEECFAAGQIWAVYDTLDAMPRFYAVIRKVYLPFKLQINWLEPNPDDNDEIKWVSVGLPVSCGKFRHGSKENCEDHAMFSHLVCWKKGSGRNNYKIYPRKGETWAIYKDWDINWYSDPQSRSKYEYEFVEVLSDYVDDTGIQVAYLGKLKDFACLFSRTRKEDMDPVLIPAKQMFKFSHKIPSFRMTGKEGKNVPAGAFELDPASLPDVSVLNGSCSKLPEDIQGRKDFQAKEGFYPTQFVEKKEISKEKDCFIEKDNAPQIHSQNLGSKGDATMADLKDNAPQIHSQNLGSKGDATMADLMEPIILSDESEASADESELKAKYEKNSSLGQTKTGDCQNNGSDSLAKDISGSPVSAQGSYDVPDPVFYDFDAERALEKFKVGQIWAIYSDEDALPKYYGRVQKVEFSDGFQLHLAWLVPSPSKHIISWKDKKMLSCCGNFKLGKGQNKYDSVEAFSHQVRVASMYEKHTYSIYPQTGEVWALYKNWSAEMKSSELENYEYHIVEVLKKDNLGITVTPLDQVNGYKSVFKPRMEGQSSVTMEIPSNEVLRFSHRIPAFRLTEEKDGSLRGFLELDTAAMPVYYFCNGDTR